MNDVVSMAVIHRRKNLPELFPCLIFTHTAVWGQVVWRDRWYFIQFLKQACHGVPYIWQDFLSAELTKHLSVLCVLCYYVQHVFSLHDLREKERENDHLNQLGHHWWQRLNFSKQNFAPGISRHEIFFLPQKSPSYTRLCTCSTDTWIPSPNVSMIYLVT